MALLGGVSWPPAHARRGSSVVCAAPALFSMGGQTLTNKPNILDWANVMEYIDLELRDIQSLRAVCRSCASEVVSVVLCHVAFHRSNLRLNPSSDPCLPTWSRCAALHV